MIFRPSKKKIDKSIKFKLDGKRLFPTESVKYLGVLLDEHLQWNKQIKHVKTKLSRAIGILSRLRHNTNLNVLKIAYHSIFGSHLQYGSQLWAQTSRENVNAIQVLQNRALRKIAFKKSNDPVSELYKDFKILKFCDLVQLQNCLFMVQLEQNEKLAKSFTELKHCGENHNYKTRAATKNLLATPFCNTDTYGTHSTKYRCITDWNNFKKSFPDLPQTDYTYIKIKTLLKKDLLSKY